MGTRGHYVYFFRGRYYIKYNHWDSYLEGLGSKCVSSIPESPEKYQEWLKALRKQLGQWEQVLEEQILCIADEKLQALSLSNASTNRELLVEPSLETLVDDRMSSGIIPSYIPPLRDLWIEYTYIFDIDREVFTIDNGAHFFLNKIPRNSWIESLAYDVHGERLVLPDLVPPDSIADLASLSSSKPVSNVMDTDVNFPEIPVVRPKGFFDFATAGRHGPLLLAHAWARLKASLEQTMPFVLRGWTPDDFAFRELAFAIVSLAAGLTSGLRFLNHTRVRSSQSQTWDGIVLSDDPYATPVVLSALAIGHHSKNSLPGSASESNSYWYHGAIIHLAANIINPHSLEKAIESVIEFGKTSAAMNKIFDAIIISIEHVVLVHVSEDRIERTEPLSMLCISTHYIVHPNKRYTEEFLERNKSAASSTEGGNEEDGKEEDEEEENQVQNEVKEHSSVHDIHGFFAMVHLFEATTKRSMPQEKFQEGVFPTEIYEMILHHVDGTTQGLCSAVSRKFRRYCLKHFRLIEGTIISGLEIDHNDTGKKTSALSVRQSGKPEGKESVVGVADHDSFATSWQNVAFMISDSTNTKFEARPVTALYQDSVDSTTWYVACGEPQRLSLCGKIAFNKFKVAGTCEEPERTLLPTGQMSRSLRRRVISTDSADGDQLEEPDLRELSARDILESWEFILQRYGIVASSGFSYDMGRNFDRPPHTQELIVKTMRGYTELGSQFVGYIKIKYTGAIRDVSETWKLARVEAEEVMREEATEQSNKQFYGIVAVDLFAELYHWDPQIEGLVLSSGGPLQILAKDDREKMGTFLQEMKATFDLKTAEAEEAIKAKQAAAQREAKDTQGRDGELD
ncbi:hypothetical protein MMC13_002482 [Lambiella insularis]|nr:hypothetical protein [Lambiella insularis]